MRDIYYEKKLTGPIHPLYVYNTGHCKEQYQSRNYNKPNMGMKKEKSEFSRMLDKSMGN